jgi:hypothetical protein
MIRVTRAKRLISVLCMLMLVFSCGVTFADRDDWDESDIWEEWKESGDRRSWQGFLNSYKARNKTSRGDFKDVKKDDWYYKSVNEMLKKGIISGYPDGYFKPNKTINRQEFAVMMVKALNLE